MAMTLEARLRHPFGLTRRRLLLMMIFLASASLCSGVKPIQRSLRPSASAGDEKHMHASRPCSE